MSRKNVVREVLDQVHRGQPAADRDVLLEVGRSLGVRGLRPGMRVLTIIRRTKAHLEAAGAQDGRV